MSACQRFYQGDLKLQQVGQFTWQSADSFKLKSFSHKGVWQAISLENQSPTALDFIWKEFIAKDSLVRFYKWNGDKAVLICSSGTSVQPQNRCFKTRYATGPIHLEQGEKAVLLVEKSSNNSLQSRASLISPQWMQKKYQEGIFIGYHYLGFALGIFAVNLLMFLVIRERNFGAYLIFHIALVSTTLLITGLVQDYLPHANWGKWISLSCTAAGLALTGFTMGLFSISLSRPGKFFTLVLLWPPVQTFLHVWGMEIHPFDDQYFFLLVLLLNLYAFSRMRRNPARVRLYLIAWGGYLFFLSCYLLNTAGVFPDLIYFRYGAYEAHAWEMAWFTVGFAKIVVTRMRRSQRMAEELERDKAEILRRFSHELRSPLMGIMGSLDLIPSAERKDLWNTVQVSSHRLLSHVNQVIEYMDLKSEKVKPNPRPILLQKELMRVFEEVQQKYADQKMHLEHNLQEYPGIELCADPDLLRQMLRPLLDNAFKFSQESTVHLALYLEEGQLNFELSNKGPALDPIEFSSLQKDFQRGEAFLRQRYGGLGLGLGIAHQNALLIGAELYALENAYGAKIHIAWPIVWHVVETSHPQAILRPCSESLVLIVDDQMINRKVLARMLESLKCRVVLAENGLVAYRKWRRLAPDLILMDLQMPVLDGWNACAWIRRTEMKQGLKHSSIAAVSAHCSAEDQNNASAQGFDLMWAKPISQKQVLEHLENLGFGNQESD